MEPCYTIGRLTREARLCGWRWPIVVLIVLLGTALGLAAEPGPSSSSIGDLKDLSQFSELFNRDAGHPRLVLLLSPT